jgi:hypothetical protein
MFPLESWATVYAGNELYKKNKLKVWIDNLSKQQYEETVKKIQKYFLH